MKDAIEKISWMLTVLGGLIVIFLIIWKLLGNSPTTDDIMLGILFLLASWTLNLNNKVTRIDVKSTLSFQKMKEDLTEIKQKLG